MPKVKIADTKLEFTVSDGSVIFEALDDQGHELAHGCLSGSCGACRIEVTSGIENLSQPSPIEQNTIDAVKINYKRIYGNDFVNKKEIRLSCRAKVNGDITIKEIN